MSLDSRWLPFVTRISLFPSVMACRVGTLSKVVHWYSMTALVREVTKKSWSIPIGWKDVITQNGSEAVLLNKFSIPFSRSLYYKIGQENNGIFYLDLVICIHLPKAKYDHSTPWRTVVFHRRQCKWISPRSYFASCRILRSWGRPARSWGWSASCASCGSSSSSGISPVSSRSSTPSTRWSDCDKDSRKCILVSGRCARQFIFAWTQVSC